MVLWFGYMEKVVCNGDDLILNPLFNFEPMKELEHWGNVRMFGRASGLEHAKLSLPRSGIITYTLT